jgi:hypothetical protein
MRKLMVLSVLAACGGNGGGTTNVKPTMRIADRADTEIALLLNAAGGADMFAAESQVLSLSPPRTDPCPSAMVAASTVTITGGCTTQDGMTIAGNVVVQNPTSWDSIPYDYSKPTVYSFEQMSFTQASYAVTYDGYVRQSGAVYDADITATSSITPVVREDLYYSCNVGTQSCSLSGSGLELAGQGVLASGSASVQGQQSAASYTLRGLDTLHATITSGCVAWKIDGTDRQKTCP